MSQVIQLANKAVFTPVALVDYDGLVVMFHSSTEGTVIQSDGHYPVGHYSSWYMGDLETAPVWKPFTGSHSLEPSL